MVAIRESTVQALSFGAEGVEARRGRCRLLGVTSKALYLQTPDDAVLALVGPEAPDGPLSIRIPGFQQIAHSLDRRPTDEIRLELGAICFADLLTISLSTNRLWSPSIPTKAVTGSDPGLLRSIACLAGEQCSQEGSAPLALALAESDMGQLQSLCSAESHVVAARIAKHFLEAMSALLDRDHDSAAKWLVGVLGVGPGLTPSGDDFLSGLLAVLKWQGGDETFTLRLAREVLIEVPKRTNRISVALLRYASNGVLYAPAMDLGHALSRGSIKDARAATLRLLGVGATTGADTVTGILAGLLIARSLASA